MPRYSHATEQQRLSRPDTPLSQFILHVGLVRRGISNVSTQTCKLAVGKAAAASELPIDKGRERKRVGYDLHAKVPGILKSWSGYYLSV